MVTRFAHPALCGQGKWISAVEVLMQAIRDARAAEAQRERERRAVRVGDHVRQEAVEEYEVAIAHRAILSSANAIFPNAHAATMKTEPSEPPTTIAPCLPRGRLCQIGTSKSS